MSDAKFLKTSRRVLIVAIFFAVLYLPICLYWGVKDSSNSGTIFMVLITFALTIFDNISLTERLQTIECSLNDRDKRSIKSSIALLILFTAISVYDAYDMHQEQVLSLQIQTEAKRN